MSRPSRDCDLRRSDRLAKSNGITKSSSGPTLAAKYDVDIGSHQSESRVIVGTPCHLTSVIQCKRQRRRETMTDRVFMQRAARSVELNLGLLLTRPRWRGVCEHVWDKPSGGVPTASLGKIHCGVGV
jgi:hypothetical protein